MNIGTAYGRIVIDASGVQAGIAQARRALTQGLADMGRSISDFGAQITAMSAPLAAMGAVGLRAASDFDSLFTQISARTGIVGAELEKLRQLALQWGADTVFSAQQAGEAFLQLLTAGVSASDAIAIMPSVLDAAAAGNMQLGQAADAVTNVMAAMGLEVSEAADLIDAVARASASSPASMGQLLEAMAEVGGMAQNAGMDFRDLAALMAIFANAGIRGAEAGTQLRSMLQAMNQPTERAATAWAAVGTSLYDSEGNARRFADVLEDIRAGLATMTDEQRNQTISALAGAYGLVGLNAILASDGIDAMLESMAQQAAASEVARAMMDTFKMSVDSLFGSMQALAITALTPFMNNVLTPMIERLIEVVNGITQWARENPELTQQIVRLTAVFVALGPTLMAVGQGMKFVSLAVGALTSPIGLIVAAVAALGLAFETNFLGIRDWVEAHALPALRAFGDWVAQLWGMVQPALERLGAWFLVDVMPQVEAIIRQRVMPMLQSFGEYLVNIWNIVSPALLQLAGWFVQDGLPVIQSFISDVALPVLDALFGLIAGAWEMVRPALEQLAKWFADAIPIITGLLSGLMNNVIQPLIRLLGGLWQSVRAGVEAFAGGVRRAIQPLIDLIEGLAARLRDVQNALNAGAAGREAAGAQIAQMQASGRQFTREELESAMWQATLDRVGGNDLAARALYPMVYNEALNDPTMRAILAGRAAGGPVTRNVPYIVGERGPELFVPHGSGHIVPNHAMGSGIQIGNITIHANSEADGRAAAVGFQRQLEEVMRANG